MNILILKQIVRESIIAHNKVIETGYFIESSPEKKVEIIINNSEILTQYIGEDELG